MASSRSSLRRALVAVLAASLLPLGLTAGPAAAATPVPLQVTPPPPTPQGPVVGSGCTGTTVVVCDLFAKAGTIDVGGLSGVPVWGFAATAAAAATPSGPVLVVAQGATVTITVHNGLASPLSLAIPNLTGFETDTAGAPPAATKSYTFTATRPGTYLYEAGHTPAGARQAAMGLVGAMIVRPAAAGSAYGNAAGAFDDEAALVLGEIDPAFNANPTAFDLRNYHPTIKMINGKAFPETDPVATAVDHKVLLRYVNAGLTDHPMGVAGTRQTIVGVDARPNPDAFPLFADTIPPGQTEDAIVGAPSAADGATFVVYETAGRLDNRGAVVGTSTVVGFGGMMTYLTTDAVAPMGDAFGPVTSKVTLAPTAVTAMGSVTLTADLSDATNGNNPVTAAEYVIDNPGDVANGTGTALTATFGTPTVTGATATLTAAVLQALPSAGTHTVYVRALDGAGNWGPVSAATFTLTKTGPTTTAGTLTPAVTNGTVDVALRATGDDTGLGGTITGAEYFVGPIGANGTGTAMTVTPGSTPAVAAESATIPAAVVAALTSGTTTVSVHTRDSFGLWGPPQALTLTITTTGPAAASPTISPNPTDGTVGSSIDPTQLSVTSTFTEPGTPAVASVAGAEGFIDTAGANGAGFVFAASDGTFDTATETGYGLIPLSQVTGLADGAHQIFVHGRDSAGNWGPFSQSVLTVDHGTVVGNVAAALTPNTPAGAPAVSTATTAIALSATATSASGAPGAAEWFADADPGPGHGRPMTIATTGTASTLTASVPPGGLSVGTHSLSVRARSAAGTWGKPAFTTVTVSALSTLLFRDTFDTSTVNWAGQVGTPPVTGGQLAPAANAAATASYVVDTTPINEGLYTAGFLFTPGTLNGGTATLFDALTTANGTVFAVQYQKAGTGYKVRLVRAGASSPWVTVTGTTARTISVHWATSATAGTATLTVSGTGVTASPSTLPGATRAAGALRIDTVRLGLTAGTAGTTGTPLIDAFTSSRN